MNIIFELVEIIACFIEIFVLYKVYNAILCKYRCIQNKYIDIVLAVIGAFIIWMCNHISLFSYFTMLIFVLYISISSAFLYNINFIAIFSLASFYLLCLSCFDFLVLTLFSGFGNGRETLSNVLSTMGVLRTIIVIVVKFFWVMLYLLIKKYFYKFSIKVSYAYTVLAISCVGFFGFIFLVNQTMKAFHYTLSSLWLSFIIVLAFLSFILYFIVVTREEKMKLNFSEMRNHLLEENYRTINEIYMSNAKLHHDLNNHLNVLYQLLEVGNTEEAKKYIKNISTPIMRLSKTIWTGADVIDVIINSKLEKMKEKGISSEINVEFPQNTNISSHDMCTILANLLDNAIEATSGLEKPGKISLTIRKINFFLMIKISNSCANHNEEFLYYPKTTKKNKELHGWGFPSVVDTVQKYNGSLKCVNKDNQFIVKIMLFFEEIPDTIK
ncbi:hypothetical protein IMSAGC011_02126 [Lachnospiraceae bacterium]|nr:hypothetical protein IMSAGC011_02126 [Lachnospiraceae bacterium]